MNRALGRLCVISWLISAPLPGWAEEQAYLISGARVFDGWQLHDGVEVLVEGSRIAAVGSNLEVPPDTRFIDGYGKTLLPGLIDCHTHNFSLSQLRESLIFGVTTAMGMWDDPALVDLARTQPAATDRADLFSARLLITAPGGHGTQFAIPIPTLDSPADARAFVAEIVSEGADFIKIVLDDGSALLADGTEIPTHNSGTLNQLIRAAHRLDLVVVTHALDMVAARRVFAHGGDGLAHVFVDEVVRESLIRRIERQGGFVIATLAVLGGVAGRDSGASVLNDPLLRPWLTRAARRSLRRSFPPPSGTWDFDTALESVRHLQRGGVAVLAGSDTNNPGIAPGASLHRELELLVFAGLSPIEALRAATALPAQHFARGDRGSIAAGKLADLVLVNGDPTENILASRDIAAIWRRGTLVDRQALFSAAGR